MNLLDIMEVLVIILAVSNDYDGPRFDDEITLDFVEELLQYYKDRKILHKKYAYKVIFKVYYVHRTICEPH